MVDETQNGDQLVVILPKNGVALEDVERAVIRQALNMCGGIQKNAAEFLHISPRVMHYKLRTLGIKWVKAGRVVEP